MMIKKILFTVLVLTCSLILAQGNGNGNGNGSNNNTGNNTNNGNGTIDPSNTFVGTNTGTNNTTGLSNVFIGGNAGVNNTTGSGNVFNGFNSGSTNTSGSNNVFLGNTSGSNNTIGGSNVFIGYESGDANTEGQRNVYIGNGAGLSNELGSGNIFIGNLAGEQLDLENDKLIIDNTGTTTPLIYGDFATDQLGINTNTVADGYNFAVNGNTQLEGELVTTGRISIGTNEDDPEYLLTVKGKVHVQEVKIDLLGAIAPDYVFYEDYDLKTLQEVEAYIEKEGHLPNIPAASEMEKKGINLKEMNLKLLEKIEELTLYTIAQEKTIKEQQEINKKLDKRLQKLEQLLEN